jgi:hypothetical protein
VRAQEKKLIASWWFIGKNGWVVKTRGRKSLGEWRSKSSGICAGHEAE